MQARSGIRGAKSVLERESVCFRCLAESFGVQSIRLSQRSSFHTKRQLRAAITVDRVANPQNVLDKYFSTNLSLDGKWRSSPRASRALPAAPASTIAGSRSGDGIESTATSRQPDTADDLSSLPPHRRRKRRKEAEKEAEEDYIIPPDASSQLTTAATSLPTTASLKRKMATYLSLSKPRLSFLMTLTTTTAYSIYPTPDILSSAAVDLSTASLTFLWLTTGTFLSSACANTLNMAFEPAYDAQMSRTRNRPLVRKLVTTRAAYMFAFLTGTSGVVLLFFGTNPTVAALGALNVFLYAGVYTPMKRLSVANTWVGAVVGAIPPMMGWVAAAGQTATLEHHSWQDLLLSPDSLGGWLLGGLLFAWQFPHFNALSHTIRDEYRNAGYRMLAWTNPAMNARVGLRYSLAMFPLCAGLWWAGYVNSGFLVLSSAANFWMTREAIKFWKKSGGGGSARGLFWASIWHLPLVMVGALICKAGIWDGFWAKAEVEDEVDAVPLVVSGTSTHEAVASTSAEHEA